MPFDEALRDVTTVKHIPHGPELGPFDPVARHGAQFLEIKSMERKGKARGVLSLESNCLFPPLLLVKELAQKEQTGSSGRGGSSELFLWGNGMGGGLCK